MFGKLLLIIIVMGATACALLVNRQQRIDTAHQAAQLHQEILRQRQQCWAIRHDIAIESQPERVREALAEIGGEWLPVVIADPAPL
jgi:outer membrane biogenesis lipoprotein LolB